MRSLASLMIVTCWSSSLIPAFAQSNSPFYRTFRNYKTSGWTANIGLHGFSAAPDTVPSLYQIIQPNVGLDTLHSGGWNHEGNRALKLGIGIWGQSPQSVIWDRWSLQLDGTRNRAISEFTGSIADSSGFLNPGGVLVDSSRSFLTTELTFRVHRAFEIIPDFFAEGHIGLGWDHEWGAYHERIGPDSMFVTRSNPSSDRIALELGVGVGVHTWGGRFLRIVGTVDALQLRPFAEEGDGRVQWFEGQYVPWNVTIHWDLLSKLPPQLCEQNPRKPPGEGDGFRESLFGDEMTKSKKKKGKKKKSKKKRRRW